MKVLKGNFLKENDRLRIYQDPVRELAQCWPCKFFVPSKRYKHFYDLDQQLQIFLGTSLASQSLYTRSMITYAISILKLWYYT